MKPPQLLRKLIYHSTLPGMIVYDAFGGSGSTLIACEQINRKCRMVEIDAKYCQTIIDRYALFCQLSNKEVKLLINKMPISA